jgi:signal transduction histidine kinase
MVSCLRVLPLSKLLLASAPLAGTNGKDSIPRCWFYNPFLASFSVAISYYVATKIGFALTPQGVPISAFWPPNAILLAALLLTPGRLWWALILAVLPAHLLVQLGLGVPLLTALGWFVGNTSEALIGAACIRRFKPGMPFDTVRGLIIFLVFGVFGAPLFTSFLDAGVVLTTGWGRGYWGLWTERLFSNMLADLTLIPTIVIFAWMDSGWIRKVKFARFLEAGLLGTGVVAISFLVFGREVPLQGGQALLYTPLPLLLWAAVRFGLGGLAPCLLAVALISVGNVMHGRGPFVGYAMSANVLSLQVFLCLIAISLMSLAAVIAELRDTEESLRRASRKLIHAQEEERYRIARELHDDIGQQLALIELEVNELHAESNSGIKQRLGRVSDRVVQVATATRQISRGLHSTQLSLLGLVPALRILCREIAEEHSLPIRFKSENIPDSVPADVSLCLYRVTQEALHNVTKHSRATAAAVELQKQGGRLLLRVVDDGRGFAVEAVSGGLGFTSMRERLRSVGGTIEIESAITKGTKIEASVPIRFKVLDAA